MSDATNEAYSYYPGCSLTATNRAYDISTRSIAQTLGIELSELDDWNCCGATAYMSVREKSSFVLSARNLAIADQQQRELVTICNACYVVLRKTNKYMAEDPDLRKDIRKALNAGGMDYSGNVKVRHLLDVLVNDVGEERIRQCVKRPLTGLKVACYCGCQLTRPFDDVDHSEFPESMEKLLGWLGADIAPFPVSTKCCGGMAMTTHPETGQILSGKILKVATDRESDCVATACPLCQINLEAYQKKLSDVMKADVAIPVLYFTQLLGVAFGLGNKELALGDCLTPAESLLAEKVGA